jgi:hypothetical protein
MNAMPHGGRIHPWLFFFTARAEWRSAEIFSSSERFPPSFSPVQVSGDDYLP